MKKTYRPGVYSQYDIVSRPKRNQDCCVFFCGGAKVQNGKNLPAGEIVQLNSIAQLKEYFAAEGDGEVFCNLCSVLLHGGVGKVYAVPLTIDGSKAAASQYTAAFEKLCRVKHSGIMLCDSMEESVLEQLVGAVREAAQRQKERIAVAAVSKETAQQVAKKQNQERLVLCCQKTNSIFYSQESELVSAAALAAMLATERPTDSFHFKILETLKAVEELTEEETEAMLQSGVTVLEESETGVECIRCVTSRTQSNGEEDRSFTQVNTIMMIDDVIRAVRERLSDLIRGGQAVFSEDSIASQTAVVLDEKKQEGYLTDFEPPIVYRQTQDSSVCTVELEFHLASVLSQIYLVAHISL